VNGRPAGHRTRRAALACAAAAALATAAAGCSSTSSEASPPPAAALERTSHGLSVVLTPLGAQRIALRTGLATAAAGGQVAVAYNALVYEPAGEPAVYVATGPLTYTRYLVPVTMIAGQTVYLKPGIVPAGATVVTQGAEELLGVQNGVGEES
jgi:hypothetical protein